VRNLGLSSLMSWLAMDRNWQLMASASTLPKPCSKKML
jgi:hypothetical protein